ncbi:MAG: hypothetical protein ACRYFX_08460 [Janthinobacterium lividum]
MCRDFSGPLKLHEKGFGFADDVYLPPALIAWHSWQPGATISGRAVMQHNKKKNKGEWNAARIDFKASPRPTRPPTPAAPRSMRPRRRRPR